MIRQSELLLSAQRAFLGRIYPEMRLVKIKAEARAEDSNVDIIIQVVVDRPATIFVHDAVLEASDQIVADFPQCGEAVEYITIWAGPIDPEESVEDGWVFRRAD